MSLLIAELRRNLWRQWAYRFDFIGDILVWLIAVPIMLIIFDDVAGGTFAQTNQLASVLGFLVWDLCMGTLNECVRHISRETQEGTLEQIFLSPIPPIWVITARIIAITLIRFIRIFIMGSLFIWLLDLNAFTLTPASILILFLTISSTVGLSLIFAGLTLAYKSIDSLIGIITLLAVLYTGALIPLNGIGATFQVLKFLVPTTWGIDTLRATLLHGQTLSTLFTNGDLIGLSLQAVALSILGIFYLYAILLSAVNENQERLKQIQDEIQLMEER